MAYKPDPVYVFNLAKCSGEIDTGKISTNLSVHKNEIIS